jgi:hypothetical protein
MPRIVVTFDLETPAYDPANPVLRKSIEGIDIATALATLLDGFNDDEWTLTNPEVFMQPPRCVMGLEGGLPTGASAEIPLDLLVLDYDTDGADQSEVYHVPQMGQDDLAECFPRDIGALHREEDRKWVEDVYQTCVEQAALCDTDEEDS